MAITAFRPLVFSWKKYIDSKFSCCMRSNTRLSISGAFPFPCSWEMIDGLLFKYRLSYHRTRVGRVCVETDRERVRTSLYLHDTSRGAPVCGGGNRVDDLSSYREQSNHSDCQQ